MPLTDTRSRYGWISIINHWTIALLILGLIAFGLVLAGMPRSPDKGALIQVHKTLGVLALALALVRIAWATLQTRPGAVEGQSVAAERLRDLLHRTLLVATVALPASGVLMSLYNGHAVAMLGLFTIPAQGEVAWIAGPAHLIHEWGSYLVLALVAGHALVSLIHHFWNDDPTLRRMLSATPR
ncbi:cytochrome b [Roseospira visakhapatnamensis]|uniref:Cytochrome b561 n=1 Tax=Roseospira visakhapatnamensis TaxID=390880 RepID=A0A7W6RAV3_9PROT|nr:cytochrome b [Roseospira visakhapatnamensis]MBB4264957.1 cytochrome b561 [Roseospira visakhapatnamensis]